MSDSRAVLYCLNRGVTCSWARLSFFLVNNLCEFDWPPDKVLALSLKLGSAEARMGEVRSALDVHLSSMDRGDSAVQDVMARNEASLMRCASNIVTALSRRAQHTICPI